MIRSVTIAKGIGIILVVIGHYYPNDCPVYWKQIILTIYQFHMPLFLILSGYLCGKLNPDQSISVSYIKKKFHRLIIPFISIATISFAIKFFAGKIFSLKHPATVKSFLMIFITKDGTYFPLLWFVYSLFVIFAIFALLKPHFRSHLFILSLFLMVFEWTDFFYLKTVFRSLPFFCFGALFLTKIDLDNMDYKSALCFCFLGISIFIIANSFPDSLSDNPTGLKILQLILGTSGSIATICIAALFNKCSRFDNILYITGFYSMSIYLFHTLFASSVRVINYQVLRSESFILPALVAIIAGLLFPLFLEIWVLRKHNVTRKFILGLS